MNIDKSSVSLEEFEKSLKNLEKIVPEIGGMVGRNLGNNANKKKKRQKRKEAKKIKQQQRKTAKGKKKK